MAKGQKAAPRSEWAESTKQKQVQWQKLNRAKLSADLPKQEGDAFRVLCKDQGISVSAALSQYVRAAIQAGTLDIIRDDIPWTRDDNGTTAGGSCRDDDGRRIDPAGRNDTPGAVDLPTANDTPGTVDIPENASD